MTKSFKNYRRDCFTVIHDLLEHRGKHVVDLYVKRAKETKTENELSRVMADVRNAI